MEEVNNPELDQIKENNAESVNLQKMREAKEESDRMAANETRRADEATAELDRLRSVQNQPAPVKANEHDDFDDDDAIEGRHLRKRDAIIKDLQNDLKDYKKQTEDTIVNNRLNLDHPDYNRVMTTENIAKLIKDYPEIADTLNANGNKYTQYKSAYRMIKKFGIYDEDKFGAEKKTIDNNMAKPLPSNSLGVGAASNPLTHANMFSNGLTDEVKAKMRALNEQYRKNY